MTTSMLCLECGAEMRLVQVVEDTTMLVSGYEHHTWQCSACSTVERRMTFSREKTPTPIAPAEHPTARPPQTALEAVQAATVETAETLPVVPTQAVPVEFPVRVNPTQAGPVPSNPSAHRLQTNARLEKLREFQDAKEAASETERKRAEFKRFWDSLL